MVGLAGYFYLAWFCDFVESTSLIKTSFAASLLPYRLGGIHYGEVLSCAQITYRSTYGFTRNIKTHENICQITLFCTKHIVVYITPIACDNRIYVFNSWKHYAVAIHDWMKMHIHITHRETARLVFVKSAFKFYPHKDYDCVSWFPYISQYTTPADSAVRRHTVYLTRWYPPKSIVGMP